MAALVVDCLAVLSSQSRGAEPPKVPILVIILADDLGVRDLGCYGHAFHETPHLDRLASEGVRFTNAYAAAPVCSPTRASLITGKHPARLQLTNFLKGDRHLEESPVLPARYADFLPLEEVTFAEELKKKGYVSAAIGKWHLGTVDHGPQKQGFDVNVANFGFQGYFKFDKLAPPLSPGKPDDDLTSRLTDGACRFIEEQKDRPFCLYLAHNSPHIPLQPRSDLLAKYEAKLKRQTPPAGAVYNPHYAALVESLDNSVGRVVETLERLKLSDKTAILFLSDNGGLAAKEGPHTPATSNAPFRGGKGDLFDGGVRIPLLVKWPGLTPAGSQCESIVSTLDILPTVCELVGQKPEPFSGSGPLDGVSMAAALKDPKVSLTSRPLYWHYPHFANQGGHPAGAIRAGDWKLIESYETGECQLFNLKNDPGEAKNVAADEPQRALELRKQLTRWRSELHTNKPRKNPEYKKGLWPAYGVSDFLLTDSQGKKVGKADLLGKPWLCCFVFTRCASTCPKVTDSMLEIQRASKSAGLRLISFTVDPDYDTPEVLNKYATGKGADLSRWSFLTADPARPQADKEAIFRLIEGSFRMPVVETTGVDRKPGFEVIHSNNIIYVDAQGHPKAKYNAVLPEDVVRLRRVIEGKAQPEEPEAVPTTASPQSQLDAQDDPVTLEESNPALSDQERWAKLPEWVRRLPAVNASLNGLATLLLVVGWVLIKQRKPLAHKRVMLSAFVVSMLFLCTYLVYHAYWGKTKFSGSEGMRVVYFGILVTHVVLAACVPFLAIATIRRGLIAEKRQLNALPGSERIFDLAGAGADWERHRRLAKITYPIWLYVSVTGVIIYLMLYHWSWFH